MKKVIDFAVNVQHTHKGDVPSKLERAAVTFEDDGSITISNRSGSSLRLDRDAAVALTLLLKAELLVPVAVASFGSNLPVEQKHWRLRRLSDKFAALQYVVIDSAALHGYRYTYDKAEATTFQAEDTAHLTQRDLRLESFTAVEHA